MRFAKRLLNFAVRTVMAPSDCTESMLSTDRRHMLSTSHAKTPSTVQPRAFSRFSIVTASVFIAAQL